MKFQNKISHLFLGGSDLQDREKEVLEDASRKTGFVPKKLIDQSHWWSSKEIGAFRYEGEFEGKRAVLKIQGIKPFTSEIYMIEAFSKANKSKILRPPLLYSFLPWDDKKRYEALILEFVDGKRVVNSPTNKNELEEFFNLREEYKKNCVANPWIDKPDFNLSEEVKLNFAKWRQASFKLYPGHQFRKNEDKDLIDSVVKILQEKYQGVEPEFQHGHFSTGDLYKVSKNEVVILSNLYWSWKPPFYDAIFGYHWFIYHLAQLKNATPDLVEQQRNLWYSKVLGLGTHLKGVRLKLLNLAFLERAAAGLNLDALSVNQKSPIAEYLVQATRREVKRLLGLIKNSL